MSPNDVQSLYVVATWVPRRTTMKVGSLGPVTFERGWYAYVGSARRGRDARVARHLRAEKPLRWHADHLFARFPGRLAWTVDGAVTECELADALDIGPGTGARVAAERRRPSTSRVAPVGAVAGRRAPRFGASDCGCAGHLLRLTRRPTTVGLAAAVTGARVRRYEHRQSDTSRVSIARPA